MMPPPTFKTSPLTLQELIWITAIKNGDHTTVAHFLASRTDGGRYTAADYLAMEIPTVVAHLVSAADALPKVGTDPTDHVRKLLSFLDDEGHGREEMGS